MVDGQKAPDGTDIGTIQFDWTSPDKVTGHYEARAMIIDGRYALEVRRKDAINNDQKLGSGYRTIQVVHEDSGDFTRVEVYEDDFWKMPCPTLPLSEQTSAAYIAMKKTTYTNAYTEGSILMWERTTPGENLVEAAGWTDADHFSSARRPKVFNWALRDNRPRLLELAVRRLDLENVIQVRGTLEIVGSVPDTKKGLGYVDYPEKGLAAVKAITYNFSDGYVNEVELFREEARLGELTPKDQQRQHSIFKQLAQLSRTVDAQARRAQQPAGPQDRPIDVSASNFITGGA